MATKTLKTTKYIKGQGQRSKKRTGIVVQSLRILAADNKLMHQAAKASGSSFNGWAVSALAREAARTLKRKQKATITTEEALG